jgi:L-histidine N-alpha-methyltransferase
MIVSENPAVAIRTQFELDVRTGLCHDGQKTLPSKYLYNALGSTLFEAISLLPQYGLTRAEERILRGCSRDLVRHLPGRVLVSELGSGNGRKTRRILQALAANEPVSYYPIEISRAALDACEAELGDMERVSIVSVEQEYLEGLATVAGVRPPGSHLLVLFLGSTIGNFASGDDARFLREVRSFMQRGDSLLLGADLLKTPERMIDAYDDPLGVTAAFNLNLLARINEELESDFNLRAFRHEARFNHVSSSIEMHLVSKTRQTVTFAQSGFAVAFNAQETIWTETCHKYTRATIAELAADSGFWVEAQWVDETWSFAETLLRAS